MCSAAAHGQRYLEPETVDGKKNQRRSIARSITDDCSSAKLYLQQLAARGEYHYTRAEISDFECSQARLAARARGWKDSAQLEHERRMAEAQAKNDEDILRWQLDFDARMSQWDRDLARMQRDWFKPLDTIWSPSHAPGITLQELVIDQSALLSSIGAESPWGEDGQFVYQSRPGSQLRDELWVPLLGNEPRDIHGFSVLPGGMDAQQPAPKNVGPQRVVDEAALDADYIRAQQRFSLGMSALQTHNPANTLEARLIEDRAMRSTPSTASLGDLLAAEREVLGSGEASTNVADNASLPFPELDQGMWSANYEDVRAAESRYLSSWAEYVGVRDPFELPDKTTAEIAMGLFHAAGHTTEAGSNVANVLAGSPARSQYDGQTGVLELEMDAVGLADSSAQSMGLDKPGLFRRVTRVGDALVAAEMIAGGIRDITDRLTDEGDVQKSSRIARLLVMGDRIEARVIDYGHASEYATTVEMYVLPSIRGRLEREPQELRHLIETTLGIDSSSW